MDVTPMPIILIEVGKSQELARTNPHQKGLRNWPSGLRSAHAESIHEQVADTTSG